MLDDRPIPPFHAVTGQPGTNHPVDQTGKPGPTGRFPLIDLFAGAGGFSLGAARAGFSVVASVEIDRYANETHARNFPHSRHLGWDIATVCGEDLLAEVGLSVGCGFGIIGGPPCQGFSEIGLRDPADARNDLFIHYMRLVAETRPAFFVAENVPGILKPVNEEWIRLALGQVPRKYKGLPPMKVCAADFGAATTRTRVFFVGYDPDQCGALGPDIFSPSREVVRTTVGEALMGLPSQISPDWSSEEQAWQPVASLAASFFQARAQGMVPPDVGDEYCLDALSIGFTSGCFGTRHTRESLRRFGRLLPGERDPVSKSPRLTTTGLCPTLRAGTGSDRGSFQAVRPIHPTEPRVITPREAARLQGFPDWYAFHPTKWHSFRQIGNSVSPLVAEGLLRSIHDRL